MKQLDHPISVEYLPLKLTRDELEKIERILKQSSKEVEIVAEGMQFDSIEELSSHFSDGRIKNLILSTRSPYVSIALTKMWGRLYVSSSEGVEAGVFYNLDQVFRSARRMLWPLYSYYSVWIINILILFDIPSFKQWADSPATTALGALGMVWVLWVVFVRLSRHSTIWLVRRSKRNFWLRKQDEVVLAIFSALIGAILGAAITLLLQYFLS